MRRSRRQRPNRRTTARNPVRRAIAKQAARPEVRRQGRTGAARASGGLAARASGAAAPPPRRMGRWLRRSVRPVGIVGLLAAVGYGGILAHRFVVQSPHFQVKQVRVSPTVHVTAAELRRLAGVGQRANIFAVDLAAVARRVERHPWIRSARVHRRLPHTLEIQVVEHRAAGVALLEGAQQDGALYLVSAEGTVFKRARLAEIDGLPLITGVHREDYRRHPAEARARIRQALDVAKRYAARPGRPPLGELHTDPVEGITLYTARQNVEIRLGRGHVVARLHRLDRVWQALSRRGKRPAIIFLDDDRHPNRVAVRLARDVRSGPS